LRGTGCADCGGRGYKGRIAVFEILRVTEPLRRAIARNASEQELRRIAVDSGMRTLIDSGVAKVRAGITTAEDVAYSMRDIEWGAVCPNCEQPVEPDFEACPHCGINLNSSCAGCGRQVQASWLKCPYCRTDLPRTNRTRTLPAAGQVEEEQPDKRQELRALRPGKPS
jgi:type IV pilus assembly protein PilB